MRARNSERVSQRPHFTEEIPDISVAKGSPASATRSAVDLLGGIKRFVKAGDRVVIKPNMSFQSPVPWGTNTHPEVVKEIAIMCHEAGASETLVLDHTLRNASLCMANSGIKDSCSSIKKTIVRAINHVSEYREVKTPDGICLTASDVMKPVLESDVLIAVPAAKSHSHTKVSLSMKGMMGLVYNRKEMHMLGLNSSIVDLCTILRADLTIIDATRVLATNGPYGPGRVFNKKTIIASKDMVAADAFAVSNFTWNGKKLQPYEVAHIKEGHDRGLGTMETGRLKIKKVIL
ncbi:DUF362 domain-containing protein [Thermodesulfobacteriota bacterium]